MIQKKENSVFVLLADKGLDKYCDFLEYAIDLALVQRMYPNDHVAEEEECFVLHRTNSIGKSVTLKMPKQLMEFEHQTREVFRYTSCNKLDDLLGIKDTARDFDGMNVHILGSSHKYKTVYLSVSIDAEKSNGESLTATIAQPGPGAKILGRIARSVEAGMGPILEMLNSSEIQFDILAIDDEQASVTFMVDADAKEIDPDAEEAWQDYWQNIIDSISYTVSINGYG